MSDDWEAKYWQQRMNQIQQQQQPKQQPHYEPAHIAQQKMKPNNGGWNDVDPITAIYSNMDGLASRGMGPQTQTVLVKPGTVYYKAIQAEGFGTTMPLVRNCGPYSDGNMREFEMLSECRCYVIDNLPAVDLSNLEPTRLKQLVQVRAPFIGTILIERSAIISPSISGSPQVLKG
jgi:hypothetical protein